MYMFGGQKKAVRDQRFKPKDARRATLACVRSYRERMAELAQTPALEVWYNLRWRFGTSRSTPVL